MTGRIEHLSDVKELDLLLRGLESTYFTDAEVTVRGSRSRIVRREDLTVLDALDTLASITVPETIDPSAVTKWQTLTNSTTQDNEQLDSLNMPQFAARRHGIEIANEVIRKWQKKAKASTHLTYFVFLASLATVAGSLFSESVSSFIISIIVAVSSGVGMHMIEKKMEQAEEALQELPTISPIKTKLMSVRTLNKLEELTNKHPELIIRKLSEFENLNEYIAGEISIDELVGTVPTQAIIEELEIVASQRKSPKNQNNTPEAELENVLAVVQHRKLITNRERHQA